MGSKAYQLHGFFFPLMAQGHLIPTIAMARLFSSHSVKTTIVTTPVNASFFSHTIDHGKQLGLDISVQLIQFPSEEAGFPPGCENASSVVNFSSAAPKFFKALDLLQQPFENLLQEFLPDFVVADMFFPWVTDAAAKFGIPRLVFHGTSFFSLCVSDSLIRHNPYENIKSETETFVVPGLPDQIELRCSQLPKFNKMPRELSRLFERIADSERRSYGVLVNSFFELEHDYVDHYRKIIGRKAWPIGPVSRHSRDAGSSIEEHTCVRWLDSKKPSSVLYVCFGSMAPFTSAQLLEIAVGLEASEQPFIWVSILKDEGAEQGRIPVGFEEKIEGKGLIVRDWAPQIRILEHPAVGGFMTHCGWNSTMESLSAGVAMITWPMFADQFYNEKLVTQVLKVGVSVGAHNYQELVGEKAVVNREDIKEAVQQLMVDGEEAKQLRSRAKEVKEMARKASEGGSSYANLTALIEELKLHPRPGGRDLD